MSAVTQRPPPRAAPPPAASAPVDGRVRVWDNSNIIESFPGLTLPFTYSVAREAYTGVYRGALRELGVAQATVDAHGALFAELLGHIQGRVYYNVSAWHEMLALLPGFGTSQPLLERMMGAARPGSPGESAAPVSHRRSDMLGLARVGWRSAVGLVLFERRARDFEQTVGALVRDVAERDLEQLSAEELLGMYDEISHRAINAWPVTIFNDLAVMVLHGAVRRAAEAWLGEGSAPTISALLRTDGILRQGPARDLHRMATFLRRHPPALAELADAPDRRRWLDSVACPAEFRDTFSRYLERWGNRCPRELQLDQPSYAEDPARLLAVLVGLAMAGEPAAEDRAEQQDRAWAAVSGLIALDRRATRAGKAVRLRVLQALIRQTRYRLAWRERMRYCRTHVFAMGRRLSRALDRRLVQLGMTERSGDLHYLDISEIRGCLRGTLSATDLADLARQRRSRFAVFADAAPPPDRFETTGPPGAASIRNHPAVPELTPAEDLHGTGVWGGIVRARCRVIRDPQADAAEPGEIIVAQSTDPGWLPLMLGAAGLLVENGSLLSHSAIVARELGLPTIVGISGLTARLSSGELVEMDGARGTVHRARSHD